MTTDYGKFAREIIKNNQYLTLGTSNPDGASWVSPVAYAFDQNFNFYWASLPNSSHSQNITKNARVSVAIFDSTQKVYTGVGLQIEGTAIRLSLSESVNAAKIYFTRPWPYPNPEIRALNFAFKKLLEKHIYYFYKFTPSKIWLNDPDAKVDVRVKVKLL